MSLLFNQTCLNERLVPSHTHTHTHIYIYIYIYIIQYHIIQQYDLYTFYSANNMKELFRNTEINNMTVKLYTKI